ncbi:hypothetical protein MKW92_014126 [Papaver armeniacum]|nr:hypothetical protein MKW92_014126 [Papaver armeniacum]
MPISSLGFGFLIRMPISKKGFDFSLRFLIVITNCDTYGLRLSNQYDLHTNERGIDKGACTNVRMNAYKGKLVVMFSELYGEVLFENERVHLDTSLQMLKKFLRGINWPTISVVPSCDVDKINELLQRELHHPLRQKYVLKFEEKTKMLTHYNPC